MSIAWNYLLLVFVVSFGAAVAVVVLVSLALVGLSAAEAAREGDTTPALFSSVTGRTVAGICLAAAAGIVLYALWIIVAK
jgi:hypothetical protein